MKIRLALKYALTLVRLITLRVLAEYLVRYIIRRIDQSMARRK